MYLVYANTSAWKTQKLAGNIKNLLCYILLLTEVRAQSGSGAPQEPKKILYQTMG